LFIVFEGGEGSGKSTQARALHRRLERNGVPAVLTFEPGGTELGNQVRNLIKNKKKIAILPGTELFLFAASRIQLIKEIIKPALEEGKIVICDRFSFSTLAYQGYGRQLSLSMVRQVNEQALQGIRPDLVILLDLPPELGFVRRKKHHDRFESMDLDFHRRVRKGYLEMASASPEDWKIIDASLSRKSINGIIWNTVEQLLKEHERE
jgi:dTMP kinase